VPPPPPIILKPSGKAVVSPVGQMEYVLKYDVFWTVKRPLRLS